MGFMETRKAFGDPVIRGTGVEIGPGLSPVYHSNVEQLLFADKRSTEDLTEWFGDSPGYEVLALDDVPSNLDFVTAHHVLEHAHDPIRDLIRWAGWLRTGGVMYVSIPSPQNSTERGRLLTPLRHILEDYFFSRTAGCYDSKQHIYSFVNAITADSGLLRPWYSEQGVEKFAEYLLFDVNQRDDHDCHWHTFDLTTAREMIESAFHLSNAGSEILVCEESEDSHYLAFRKTTRGRTPAGLLAFRDNLNAAAQAVGLAI